MTETEKEQPRPFSKLISCFGYDKGKPTETSSISAILAGIQGGNFKTKIEALRKILATRTTKNTKEIDKEYSEQKKNLPSVTFSGVWEYRKKEQPIKTVSGFIVLDIDHVEGKLSTIKSQLKSDPHTACVFDSPSGEGCKALFLATLTGNPDEYERTWAAIRDYLEAKYGIALDKSGKDITRLCFVSHDPSLFINPKPELFPVPKEQPKPEPKELPAAKKLTKSGDLAVETYAKKALEAAYTKISEAPQGVKNPTLNSEAFSMGTLIGAGVIDRGTVENELFRAAKNTGYTNEHDIKSILKSSLDAGEAKPRNISEIGKQSAEKKAKEPAKPDEWTTPICFLEKIALPKFPSHCLPDALRRYVEAVADCRQVPVDLPALLAISVGAAAGAGKYRVYIGNSHSEPLNIWTVSALPPGSRKTDTFEDMAKPLYIEQNRLSQEMKAVIDEAKSLQKIHEKRMEYVLSRAVKEKDPDKREELEHQYAEMGQSGGVRVPAYPCLIASGDTTPEAAAALLEEQGGKIAIMDTEGGLFSMIAGRYDGKGESNMDVWLKMHAGDELSIHRKNRPPIEVSKPAGTVAITVQPAVIKDLATKKDFKDRGLLGRFLYAIPESLVGTRFYQNKRVDQAVKNTYLTAIKRIFEQPEAQPMDDNDRTPHHRIYIKGAALEIWEEFYNDLEARQAKGGDLEGITDWSSKCAGVIARIAGIFHIIETGGNPDQDEISIETIGRAYEIGRIHLIEHAKAAYGLMNMTADTHLARDILSWIAAKGKTVFTATDFWVDNRSKGNCLDDLLPAFELLEDRGIIRELPSVSTGGRKPKCKYEVNPSCKACFRCLKEE